AVHFPSERAPSARVISGGVSCVFEPLPRRVRRTVCVRLTIGWRLCRPVGTKEKGGGVTFLGRCPRLPHAAPLGLKRRGGVLFLGRCPRLSHAAPLGLKRRGGVTFLGRCPRLPHAAPLGLKRRGGVTFLGRCPRLAHAAPL